MLKFGGRFVGLGGFVLGGGFSKFGHLTLGFGGRVGFGRRVGSVVCGHVGDLIGLARFVVFVGFVGLAGLVGLLFSAYAPFAVLVVVGNLVLIVVALFLFLSCIMCETTGVFPSCTQHDPNMKPSMHMPRCLPSVLRHSHTNMHVPRSPEISQLRGEM